MTDTPRTAAGHSPHDDWWCECGHPYLFSHEQRIEAEALPTGEALAAAADLVGMTAFWVESPSAPLKDGIRFTTMTFDYEAWAAAILTALKEQP